MKFELEKILEINIIKLVNEWYKPLLIKENLTDVICHPLIVMSIDTLFRYSEVFKQKGFQCIFNEFFENNLKSFTNLEWDMDPFAYFDMYMRQKYRLSLAKRKYYTDIISRMTRLF